MLRRSIRISCGVITTLCITQVISNLNLYHYGVNIVRAEELCTTAESCDEQIKAAQRRISDENLKIDETVDTLSEMEEDWSEVIARIETTQLGIAELESKIEETLSSIQDYNEELIQLDEEVIDLQELIGYRMRIAQRMNNGNEVMEFLTDSDTVVDLIRRVRIINHLSKSDVELMEELTILIERQQTMLATLQEKKVDLTVKNNYLESEKIMLIKDQKLLEGRMDRLAQQIKSSEVTIINEGEALRISKAQKEVLARVEIPHVHLHPNSNTRNHHENFNNDENLDDNTSSITPESSKFILPMTSGLVTCDFMCHPTHTGIDISHTNSSAPILAAASGVVTTSGWHNAYGFWVIIEHHINGERYGTLYAHLRDTPMVSEGDIVTQGQEIGIMGSTGNSSGPHLHFEIHVDGWSSNNAVDPRHYLSFPSEGTWY